MKKPMDTGENKIGYWSAMAIGVGGMVGGGIFAVLGLAVQMAGGGVPVAFLLSGIVALVTAYAYVRLSVTYPSAGGSVEFLNQAFGTGLLTGGLNILLWLNYVVMLSLYAVAFGSYGMGFFAASLQPLIKHVLISAVILVLALLNVLGAKIVGEAEEWIVGVKIAILLLFIFTGVRTMDIHRLSPVVWSPPISLAAGGMIIFLAYEGFELIANTAQEVREPHRTLPRAYFSSVGFVILLYILVSMVTVGNLSVGKIVAAKEYALAEAAKPFLGNFGFTLIAVAAMLSTGSAINATLYGASRISYIIAKDGELPEFLERKIWNRPVEGLIVTSILALLIANFSELSSISMMGSAGFLLIFTAVNAANFRLFDKTESIRWISGLGAMVCLISFGALIWQTTRTSPEKLWMLAIMLGASFFIEAIYRGVTGREILSAQRNVLDSNS